jgi:hypothetical protein
MSGQQLSPMGQAMERDDADAVAELLRADPEKIHMQTGVGTLIHYAATKRAIKTVKRLVELGFDVNTPAHPDDPPEGPLCNAVTGGSAELVRWLLEQGARSDCVVKSEGGVTRNFALHQAIEDGRLDLVKLLVEHGANVSVYYSDRTPLLVAQNMGQEEITEYLRSKGAKLPWQLAGQPMGGHRLAGADDPQGVRLEHISKHLGKPAPLSQQEIVSGDPPVSIHLIPPTGKRNRVTLVTTGMSDRPMAVPEGGEEYQFAELFIDLPGDWPTTPKKLADPKYGWPLDCLRRLARYPHDHNLWLGGARAVVANGEPPAPIAPGVSFTAFLLLTSDVPEDRLTLPDGRVVHFYRVFPLYTEEYRLEREHGTDALITLFQRYKVAMTADPIRKNVVKPRGK